jgi:hypothetical protein
VVEDGGTAGAEVEQEDVQPLEGERGRRPDVVPEAARQGERQSDAEYEPVRQ